MTIGNRVSTGLPGFDDVIDMLRLGDNVVWQIGSVSEYEDIVMPFVDAAKEAGRRVVYFRFGNHRPLLDAADVDCVYEVDAATGFEGFATKTHQIIAEEGEKVFYVFDCLSDLLEQWYSDLMIGNFFDVTCPFLFRLDTVAYFALMRGIHTNETIARIRTTTQLLLDLRSIRGKTYIHPMKVWERYSPTMYFPHLIQDGKAISITASSEAATLFSGQWHLQQARDFWEITLERARAALVGTVRERELMKNLLIDVIIGREQGIARLADAYFTLEALLYVASREIGTGYIGGKSVGFLLARCILEANASDELLAHMEPHDSYYIGSDIFYTYIVQNDCWDLRMKQKTPEGYFAHAEALKARLLQGRFPAVIREQFEQMLEYFGQSPIIVRSSSLQEDGYGNAFAGKYESVFCANQGSPEERYTAFEQAVRRVYASVMSEDALRYRKDRGLTEEDEQMAILVQRVSGDHYGDLFFPHVAGVANSVNLYLWDPRMDPNAGMLRLVFGLGTRAVDRVSGDYAKIVALDCPEERPPVNYDEEAKFSQRQADVLNLKENSLTSVSVNHLAADDLRTDKILFFTPDSELMGRMREAGRTLSPRPVIANFNGLLSATCFPLLMQQILDVLTQAYRYPVDIEFTANFARAGAFRINVLQCRPLQARGLEATKMAPDCPDECVFVRTQGHFMGGNRDIPIEYVVLIRPEEYLALSEQEKYQVARLIGIINQELRPHRVLLIGPGRWGTTTPSLGIPVHFTELSHVAAVCEVAYNEMTPELSFGSHFFQDLVESDIFYMAVYGDAEHVLFRPESLHAFPEVDKEWGEGYRSVNHVVHVMETPGLRLYSDIVDQIALCYAEE